ncbi:MAG: hypothetical protein COA49_07280 [Bacteroidetes bacterium]|nr:MAG: hypothetical protein COA49_07280 [Bacteroidota bacterium]
MKTLTSILALFFISGCIIQQPNQVVDPCTEKVDRLISIFENDVIAKEGLSIGACLMTPIEDEIIDIVNNNDNCFIGLPTSIIFDSFPGGIEEKYKVAGFDKHYLTYLAQCYEDTVVKGMFYLKKNSNDELIDSLVIVDLSDFRRTTKFIDY